MRNSTEKPSHEAKALSLYLMAFKKTSPIHKEKSRRINKMWKKVLNDEMSSEDYVKEVENLLTSFGGYTEVLEKTVKFYIDKTGEWNLKGIDKYSLDAQNFADKLLNS